MDNNFDSLICKNLLECLNGNINKIIESNEADLIKQLLFDYHNNYEKLNDTDKKIIDILYEHGIPRYELLMDVTLLIFACRNRNYYMAQELIKMGADVNIGCQLYYVDPCSFDHEILERTPLMYACINQSIDIIDLLIKNNAILDQKDKFGYTALHSACRDNSNIDVILCLISGGASVNIEDFYLRFPIHYASVGNCPIETLDFLICNGANINCQDMVGYSPLMMTLRKKCYDRASHLISYGCDLNIQDHDGNTALIIILKQNMYEYALDLILYGCDLNIRNNKGYSALIYAIRHCKDAENIIESLLKHGANYELTDYNGNTPFMHAVDRNKYTYARLLVSYGCNINMRIKYMCNNPMVNLFDFLDYIIDPIEHIDYEIQGEKIIFGIHDPFDLSIKFKNMGILFEIIDIDDNNFRCDIYVSDLLLFYLTKNPKNIYSY